MKKDSIIESIEYWEQAHKMWWTDPDWRINAPNYGEVCAKIIVGKLDYLKHGIDL